MSQATLAFPESEGDADDYATKKPKKKRLEANASSDAWPNCAKGKHSLCATKVFENSTGNTIHCGCDCHKW